MKTRKSNLMKFAGRLRKEGRGSESFHCQRQRGFNNMEYLIGKVINKAASEVKSGEAYARAVRGGDSVLKPKNRTITGYCSVFGSVDSGDDIVLPGAFKKTIELFNAGQSRCRFLWNHDSTSPPVGKILEIKEVTRAQMPAAYASLLDVSGALQVTRKYFEDDFTERIYQGIVSGAISEMSFGFNLIKHRYEEVNGKRIRILEEIELMDIADVNWGMHPNTSAAIKGPQIRNAAKAASDKEWAMSKAKAYRFIAETNYQLNPVKRKLHHVPAGLGWVSDARKQLESLQRSVQIMELKNFSASL